MKDWCKIKTLKFYKKFGLLLGASFGQKMSENSSFKILAKVAIKMQIKLVRFKMKIQQDSNQCSQTNINCLNLFVQLKFGRKAWRLYLFPNACLTICSIKKELLAI
jgi:hypothetical protein